MKYELILKPGQILWYCNRNTGELGTVQVKTAHVGEFIVEYKNKLYRLPSTALGTRLFFTRKGAANPSEIMKNRARRENNANNSVNAKGYNEDFYDLFIEKNEYIKTGSADDYDYWHEYKREYEDYCVDYNNYCAEFSDDPSSNCE